MTQCHILLFCLLWEQLSNKEKFCFVISGILEFSEVLLVIPAIPNSSIQLTWKTLWTSNFI